MKNKTVLLETETIIWEMKKLKQRVSLGCQSLAWRCHNLSPGSPDPQGWAPLPPQPARGTHLGVVKAVFLLHSIATQRVVIKAGVFEEADPFLPAWWHVGAVVFIKVLPEESWRGEAPGSHVRLQRAKAFSCHHSTEISKPRQARTWRQHCPLNHGAPQPASAVRDPLLKCFHMQNIKYIG